MTTREHKTHTCVSRHASLTHSVTHVRLKKQHQANLSKTQHTNRTKVMAPLPFHLTHRNKDSSSQTHTKMKQQNQRHERQRQASQTPFDKTLRSSQAILHPDANQRTQLGCRRDTHRGSKSETSVKATAWTRPTPSLDFLAGRHAAVSRQTPLTHHSPGHTSFVGGACTFLGLTVGATPLRLSRRQLTKKQAFLAPHLPVAL